MTNPGSDQLRSSLSGKTVDKTFQKQEARMSLKSNSLSMLIEKKRGRIAEELARFEEAAAVLEMVPRKAGLRIRFVLGQKKAVFTRKIR